MIYLTNRIFLNPCIQDAAMMHSYAKKRQYLPPIFCKLFLAKSVKCDAALKHTSVIWIFFIHPKNIGIPLFDRWIAVLIIVI